MLTPELLIPVNPCSPWVHIGLCFRALEVRRPLCESQRWSSQNPNADHLNGDGPRFEHSMILVTFPWGGGGGNHLVSLALEAVPGIVNKFHCSGIHWGQLCLEE